MDGDFAPSVEMVVCMDCGARSKVFEGHDDRRTKAAWNQRVSEELKYERLAVDCLRSVAKYGRNSYADRVVKRALALRESAK